MKFSLLIMFVHILLLIPAPTQAACSKEMLIGYSDWSRTGHTEPRGTYFSLDEDLVRLILEEANCQYRFHALSNKRILLALRHGQIDASIGMSRTPEREEYGWFTVPYRREIIAMFMLKENINTFQPETITDLRTSKFRIGAGIGSWHGDAFEKMLTMFPNFKERVFYTDDFDLMNAWLLRGRVQIVLNDLHYGLHALRQSELQDKIAPHPFYINNAAVHIMLSKKTIQETDILHLNKAIGRLKTSKKYRKTLKAFSTPQ